MQKFDWTRRVCSDRENPQNPVYSHSFQPLDCSISSSQAWSKKELSGMKVLIFLWSTLTRKGEGKLG